MTKQVNRSVLQTGQSVCLEVSMATDTAQASESPIHAGAFASPIIDLRQYTLYPGTRDEFINLFDGQFVETQEACDMRLIGQFRDLGDPNKFVWMRGFDDMPSRARALNAFYLHSEAWARYGEKARSSMRDSTDALMLKPVSEERGFRLHDPALRPALESPPPCGLIVVTLYYLPDRPEPDFFEFFFNAVEPLQARAGARSFGLFTREYSANNFPRLPLRENEHVVVSFAALDSIDAYHRYLTAIGHDGGWRSDVYPDLVRRLYGRPQVLRLSPTSRSLLRP
ncbi:NIPSNAP family protein [Bradyrhizobium zhanjiangense]|uniref:NIPSNAP family protein n=1 Tax=Bradyrhizobium zhanjiangense TaxID=1325107 RepID=UPI001008E9A9|nr:NIPSNAP family protein [Bradyrhizobium zhanjiangense]